MLGQAHSRLNERTCLVNRSATSSGRLSTHSPSPPNGPVCRLRLGVADSPPETDCRESTPARHPGGPCLCLMFVFVYETFRDPSLQEFFFGVKEPKGWLHAILRQFLVANLLKRPSREQVR